MIILLQNAIDTLPTSQVVLALTMAFSMLAIVLELVRRQKLREDYAILWIATATVLIILALSPGILTWFSAMFETQSLVSMLYFGAFVFLLLVSLQFSVRLTKLTFRSKTTSQRIALLESEIDTLRKRLEDSDRARERDAREHAAEPTVEVPTPPTAGQSGASIEPAVTKALRDKATRDKKVS